MEDKELEAYIADLQSQGYSEDQIFETLDLIEGEGKTEEPQIEQDAPVVPEDGVSSSDTPSLASPEEIQPTAEEREAERALKEETFRAAHANLPGAAGAVASLPDFLLEPYAAFESTLLGFGSGVADFATQQYARFDKAKYKPDEETGELIADDSGSTVIELLEQATPEERHAIWDNYSEAGDNIRAVTEGSQFAEDRGSGSISTELANGNFANAGQLTVNQTASGLASLVPFLVPGGTIIGPAVLGASAASGAFEEDIHDVEKTGDATVNQIYNASYLKGGVEFATELVTGAIVGKAKKLAGGGAAQKAVKEFSRGAFSSVLGDTVAEGVSEGLADTGSRLVDSAIYGADFDWKEAAVGFVDSAIIGAIVGGKVSTYGQLAKEGPGKKVAGQVLRTEAHVDADVADAKEAQAAQDAINELQDKATEGSLVDEVLLEQATEQRDGAIERAVTRQTEHQKTLDDMTKPELLEYAKSIDSQKKIDEALKDKTLSPDAKKALEDKKQTEKEYGDSQYEVVAQWPAVTKQAQDIETAIDEELKLIEMEEAQATKAENPNPVGTYKRNTKKKELNEKKKGLNEELDSKRPSVADAKTRKRKAKTKPVEVAKDAVKPIKDKAKRAEANADLVQTINDPDIPDAQKEKATSDFFKINAPLVTSIANTVANKTGRSDRKDLKDLVKTELFNQVQKKGKLDNKAIANASKAVERLAKSESQTVRPPRQDSVKAELRAIDQEVLDGTLDPEAAEILKDDIRNDKSSTEGIEQATEEGNVVPDYIEKAYTQPDQGPKDKELVDKALKGTSVEQLTSDPSNNTEKLYALLPESAKSGKSFSGIFSNGNPPVEVWESYFDKTDRQGKDRARQLKKAIDKRVTEAGAEAAYESDNFSDTEAFTDSIEFLEDKAKVKVKMFLPLLAKLKKNFPGSKIIISKTRMIEDFIAAGIDPGKVDDVKGYTDGTTVVLNPDRLDAETPIHEFGHIWAQNTRQERPDLYKRGAELIKKSSEFRELLDKAKDKNSVYYGKDRSALIEEAMATAIGRHGEQIFESKADQSQWDKLTKQIWDFIGKKLGIAKVQDLTLDQFVKLAATEIITGEKFITKQNIADLDVTLAPKEQQFLVVPAGTTRDHTQATAPITEIDTHGAFKGHKLSTELDGVLDKHGPALEAGGWVGWTTGSYGAAVEGTSKFNPKLNDRIQQKVDGTKKYLDKKGYKLTQDPINPGFHVIKKKPSLAFLESDLNKANQLKKLLNGKHLYKNSSPYKKSKITQETRDIISATKRDFALRGHLLNEAGTNKLISSLKDLIENGKQDQKSKLAESKSVKKGQADKAAEIVQGISGVDADTLTPAQQSVRAKKQGSFISDLKKGEISNALARLLSPDSNNDFYGLLYSLMPTGKDRNKTKDYIKENITDVLEDANYNYLDTKSALSQNWKDIMAQNGYTKKSLSKKSGIDIDGLDITDSQVAKIYNYIKDPSLYKQLEAGGVTVAKMTQILDYLDANPKLKNLANQVPSLYSGAQTTINSKLDEHGYKGVASSDIVKPEAGAALDILARVYDGKIPLQAPYTPFTAQGSDTSLEIDSVFEGEGDYYSVMSGNLKRRTGGGAIDVHGKNLDSDIDNYIRGPLRSAAFLDFARNSSAFFTGKNMKAMEASFGKEWSLSMKDSLKRSITGRNTPVNETSSAKAVRSFINNTVGGIMFLNTRSAVLQLISTANFSVKNPKLYGKGLISPRKKEAMDLITNSPWYKERGEGRSQLELSEIFDDQKGGKAGKAVKSVLQAGYKLTQAGDRAAIAYGGAPLVAAMLEQGLSPDQALKEFIKQSEETQQSTNAARLGREQTSTFGRAILAFANTPMQYNRKMQKAFKDLNAKGSTPAQKAEAIRSIVYYGALQNAIFTTAQQGLWTAIGLDSNDDEDKVLGAANSMLDTVLRGSGIYGAVAATMKNILIQFSKNDKRSGGDKAIQALINTIPALGTKARQLKKAAPGSRLYRESKGAVKIDASIVRAANATAFVTNIPLDRVIKKLEGVSDLAARDLNFIEKAFRVLGWSRYNLGKKGTPLKKSDGTVWGRANKDGSIEVNPDLSPAQKKQTIAHEEEHQREMASGDLDYDDNSVIYKGESYARKGGKIEINGQMVPEGDSSLPWEAHAESAESPLKNIHDDEDGHEEGGHEESSEFTNEWFNDPATRERLATQSGLNNEEIDSRLTRATGIVPQQDAFLGADAEYDSGYTRGYKADGTYGDIDKDDPAYQEAKIKLGVDPTAEGNRSTLAHEQGHALGFDNKLGVEAQKILGKAKGGGASEERYLNNPGETYGHIQGLRKAVGLKPFERNLTPKKLQDLIKFSGAEKDGDVNRLLKNYDIKNLTKALNTVASNDPKKKKSLEDLYDNQNTDTYA